MWSRVDSISHVWLKRRSILVHIILVESKQQRQVGQQDLNKYSIVREYNHLTDTIVLVIATVLVIDTDKFNASARKIINCLFNFQQR